MPKNPSFQDVNDLFNRFHGEIEALIMVCSVIRSATIS